MSIVDEITRLTSAKADIKAAIEAKGVSVPSSALLDAFPSYVSAISGGGGGVSVEAFAVSANGVYTAPSGVAYSPVTVTVPMGGIQYADIAVRTVSGYATGSPAFVASNAFQSCSMTGVSFDTASFIGSAAFSNCKQLSEAYFSTATTIQQSAFAFCQSLTTISFPKASSIQTSAFWSCVYLESAYLPSLTSTGNSLFNYCRRMTTASFPLMTYVQVGTFYSCYSLETVSIPSAAFIYGSAFYACSQLQYAYFPVARLLSNSAFYSCWNMSWASFPSATTIYSTVFYRNFKLLSLYLLGSSVPTLSNINAFSSTPIYNYTSSTGGVLGSIFVRESLYNAFITATNWVNLSSRFVSLTDAQIAALS